MNSRGLPAKNKAIKKSSHFLNACHKARKTNRDIPFQFLKTLNFFSPGKKLISPDKSPAWQQTNRKAMPTISSSKFSLFLPTLACRLLMLALHQRRRRLPRRLPYLILTLPLLLAYSNLCFRWD